MNSIELLQHLRSEFADKGYVGLVYYVTQSDDKFFVNSMPLDYSVENEDSSIVRLDKLQTVDGFRFFLQSDEGIEFLRGIRFECNEA